MIPILRDALNSEARDHVRIGHRGAGAHRGQFTSARFQPDTGYLEIMLEGNKDDAEIWKKLLSNLCSGTVRFGGKTRRGFGLFKISYLLEKAVFDRRMDRG